MNPTESQLIQEKYIREKERISLKWDNLSRLRNTTHSSTGSREKLNVPVELGLSQQIAQLCNQDEQLTYTFWLSGLSWLLHKYSGHSQIFVHTGLPAGKNVSGRMLLQMAIDGEQSFKAFFNAHKAEISKLFGTTAIPNEENATPDILHAGFFHESNAKLSNRHALALVISQTAIDVHYDSELFNRSLLCHLTENLLYLVGQIAGSPQSLMKDYAFIRPQEIALLTKEFISVEEAFNAPASVWEGLTHNQQAFADRIALTDRNSSLTYAQLTDKALQLAACLQQKHQISKGDKVAILMEHSPDIIPAILGVMAAGAVFVPIDHRYPRERISSILNEAGASLLISESFFMADLMTFYVGKLLIADLEETEIAEFEPIKPVPVSADDDCYVLFTSGSTGKPKGVLNSHGALANYAAWANQYYFEGVQGYPFAFFTSISFDLTFTSIFSTLLRGDSIIVSSQQEPDKALAQIFAEGSEVNTVKLTPSHIELLKEVHSGASPVKKVIVGGEALLTGQVEFLQSVNPEIEIYNEYGPTETTVGCTVQKVTSAQDINIGRPMAGNRVYVIDEAGRPQPVGIPGELVVAGAGLAKGYLNDEALTSRKFREVTGGALPETRIYHTGDLARWLPNGELVFIGRTDRQVKVRGHRVELADVEQAMLAHMPVDQAIVVLHNKQLVAYYTSDKDQKPAVEQLSAHLPDYMIPHSFIRLDKVPLTTNGKTDYKQLPDPEKAQQSKQFIAPENQTEQILVDIWQDVLGKTNISTHDNFFTLGGDSIKAISLISKTNQALNVSLEVKDVFNHQTVQTLAAMLTRHQADPLATEKAVQELEAFKETKLEELKQKGVNPEELEDLYPLSDIELGMIFYNQLQKEMATYHDQFFYLFEDPNFDREKLMDALSWLSQKHDILRAQYVFSQNETPYKRIWRTVEVAEKLQWFDLTGQSRDAQQRQVEKAMQTDRELGFDEEVGLWRILIFNMGQAQYGFLLSFHHAIIDGWSRASFVMELNKVYEALQKGEKLPKPDLQSTYKDYLIDQLSTAESEAIKDYWKEELRGFSLTNLPYRTGSYPTKKVTHRVAFDLEGPLKEDLLDYTKRSGISLKHLTFGVFMQLIKLTTSTRDAVVGLVTNGRPALPDAEKVIGCFLNTVPYRDSTDIESIAGEDYLQQVHDKLITLKSYDKLSLIKIRQMIGLDGNQNLFDILYSYVDFFIYQAVDNINMMDSDVEYFESTNTNFDFGFGNSNGYMGYSIAYNPEIYSRDEIVYFGECYRDLLAYFLAQPSLPINASALLKEDQLNSFNQQDTFKTPASIWEGLTHNQQAFADLIAVKDRNSSLTYTQLTDKALQLAACLQQKHQISKGDKVAILMEHSLDIIPAILGVMAAGAVFVPIDHRYPRERISSILNEAGASLLISESFFMADLMTFYVGKLLIADLEETEIAEFEPIEPVPVSADDDCYVLFTSGSTGKPKGVLNSHGALANYAAWANQYYFQGVQGYPFAFFTSISFDLTFTSIFSTLLRGDSIIVSSQQEPDKALAQIFAEGSEVNTVKLTPSHIELLKEVHSGASPVKKVIVGGEALLTGQVEFLQSINPEIEIYNEYGPTETTVGCTVQKVISAQDINIGKPMAGNRVYVIDEAGRLQPVGIPGELVVAGAGLAKGYLNDKALTSRKFSEVTGGALPETRIYHTGDLARWLPSGELVFIGRTDRQVKVRGHRVELADVEQAMLAHMPVDQAIVVLHNKQLVAYYNSDKDQQPAGEQLSAHLPDYMIPHSFIRLEKVPLTTNGKTDYKQLPDPDKAQESKQFIAPENQTEQILVDIWQEVLGKTNISTHDNFFTLGGDSIKAIQVCARVQNHGYRLEVNDLFEGLEIRKVAAAMETLEKVSEQGLITGPVPLTPIQNRFLDHYLQNPNHFHQSFVLALKQNHSIDDLNAIFYKLIQHHDSLRIKVEEAETTGLWQQENTDQFEAFRVLELGVFESANDEALIGMVQPIYQEIKLDNPPLIRALLADINDQQHLIIIVHHMAVDGVSWRILLEDLEQLLKAPGALKLPLKTDSFKYWAESLERYSQEAGFQEKLNFWKERISVHNSRITPEQNPDLPDVVADDRVVSMNVGKELTELLNSEALHSKFNTEITDFLFAGLGLTYREFFGQEVLNMALESHGRERIREDLNINRTLGWFTNIYPASFTLTNTENLSELVKSFKDETRRLKHHAIDYGVARYLLGAIDDTEPNVCFNYLGQFSQPGSQQFEVVTMGLGDLMNQQELREYQFVFSGVIINQSLNLQLSFNQQHFREESMENFLAQYRNNLALLAESVQNQTQQELTVTDLTYEGLSNEDLDEINALL